ncbi:MAG: GldG family protein [Ruminococcus sp.]|nr:GldG family protein [Ruminococcus sp.]
MSEENKNITAVEAEENKAIDDAVENKTKAKADKKKSGNKKGGLKALLSSRKAKYGSLSVAIIAVVIAIVVILNIISSLLVDRFPNLKIDMTSNNAYSIQEDTEDYMEHLSKDVNIYVLMTKAQFEAGGTYTIQAQNLIDKMINSADGKVKLDYIDLSTNPTFTAKYSDVDWSDSQASNMFLVECGKNYKVLTLQDCFDYDQQSYYYYGQLNITGTKIEQALVTAILNVTTDDKVVIDLLTGSQEQDYSAIKTLLENNAYQVNEINLTTQEPDSDAKAVMLYAPSVDLDETAVDKLSNWLDNGGNYGKNLIYVPAADKADTPNLDNFLSEWGMKVNDNYVFETSGDYLVSQSSPYVFLVDYNTEYYTDNLKNKNIPVVVIDSRDIEITDSDNAHSLLNTSKDAGLFPFDADESWNYKDAMTGDTISVAAEGVKTNTNDETSKVIVFGSYPMFSSDVMSYNSYNNSAYLMNVFNTIADKDDTGITIESKGMENKELGVTTSSAIITAFVVFVAVIPLIVVIIGVVMWIRRRNK